MPPPAGVRLGGGGVGGRGAAGAGCGVAVRHHLQPGPDPDLRPDGPPTPQSAPPCPLPRRSPFRIRAAAPAEAADAPTRSDPLKSRFQPALTHSSQPSVRQWLRESFFRTDGSIVGENFVGKSVPKHLLRNISPFVESLLADYAAAGGPALAAADLPILCHPGGPAILDSIRKALELQPWQFDHSWRVLSERGNMSGERPGALPGARGARAGGCGAGRGVGGRGARGLLTRRGRVSNLQAPRIWRCWSRSSSRPPRCRAAAERRTRWGWPSARGWRWRDSCLRCCEGEGGEGRL